MGVAIIMASLAIMAIMATESMAKIYVLSGQPSNREPRGKVTFGAFGKVSARGRRRSAESNSAPADRIEGSKKVSLGLADMIDSTIAAQVEQRTGRSGYAVCTGECSILEPPWDIATLRGASVHARESGSVGLDIDLI